jgi:hypothetical protein
MNKVFQYKQGRETTAEKLPVFRKKITRFDQIHPSTELDDTRSNAIDRQLRFPLENISLLDDCFER